jgi:CHAD domain-containing protein
MALPPAILDQTPTEGARAVALALLAAARMQAGRVGQQGDPEALHDFRVAVRRLRSTLRAWRDVLDPAVREKDLRRLRRVARATGDARDAEVLVAWLGEAAAGVVPASGAAAWLRTRLGERTRHPDGAKAAERLVETCDRLARRLGRARGGAAGDGPAEVRFAGALAGRIRDHAGSVARWLGRVETPADAPAAHRARIAGKRLRYLLEPLRDTPGGASREAARAVKALKRLQDLLGELQDARMAAEALREARLDPASRRHRAELRALEERATRRAATLLARLRKEIVPTRGAEVLAPALAVAAALEARPSGPTA